MAFDEYLIQEVQKNELLYNLSHPDYKNIAKKEATWHKIAERGKTKAILCKKRWKTLRDTYKKNKSLRNFENKRPWKYFDMMTFLEYVHSSRRITEDIECKSENIEDTDPIQVANIEMYNTSILGSDGQLNGASHTKKSNLMNGEFPEFTRSYNFANIVDLDNCNTKSSNDDCSSTLQLFEALARKVISSNLTAAQITDIESSVSALVFQKLTRIMRRNEI